MIHWHSRIFMNSVTFLELIPSQTTFSSTADFRFAVRESPKGLPALDNVWRLHFLDTYRNTAHVCVFLFKKRMKILHRVLYNIVLKYCSILSLNSELFQKITNFRKIIREKRYQHLLMYIWAFILIDCCIYSPFQLRSASRSRIMSTGIAVHQGRYLWMHWRSSRRLEETYCWNCGRHKRSRVRWRTWCSYHWRIWIKGIFIFKYQLSILQVLNDNVVENLLLK